MNKKHHLRTTHITFLGWKAENHARQFVGSVDYWEQEAQAKRLTPPMPFGVFQISGKEDEVEGIGTVPGSILAVTYDDSAVTIDDIIGYMTLFGIQVERN